jgi:hypothetical protein
MKLAQRSIAGTTKPGRASSWLTALVEELHTDKPKWERVTKLMTGIRDALKGLTSLTVSADALWNAIEKVIR